ncbi:MAG: DNA translocase FtsK, partial [Lachnospiraceae bacterium]
GVLTFDDDEWVPEEDEKEAPAPTPTPVKAAPAPAASVQEEAPAPAAPAAEEVPPLSDIPIHRETPEQEEAPSQKEEPLPEEETYQEEAAPENETLQEAPAPSKEAETAPEPDAEEETPEEANETKTQEEAPVSAASMEAKEEPSAPTEIYHVDDLPVQKPAQEPQEAPAAPAGRPAFRSRAARDFVTSEAASDASDILVRKEGTLSGKQEIVEEAKAEEEKARQAEKILETQEQQAQERKVAPIPQEEAAPAPSAKPRPYVAPPIDLLRPGTKIDAAASEQELRETAAKLQSTLETFGVRVHITEISQGPAVTRYEMQPEMGVKVSKILALQDDIKLALAATDIRIEAPIPGKSAVGVEVPNVIRETVSLRDVLDSKEFHTAKSKTAFGVGKDLSGKIVVTDIAKMPHVLIAGATGSGKSVCINTMIMSILYHASPSEVKLIMIDPKVVELSVYNGIPHLMLPVVTDSQKAAATLNWCVAEMESRFKKFAENQVRDIKGYNALVKSRELEGDTSLAFMPSIVIIVDELADLMMVAKSEVETAICRLAQLARAAGMHLVIATQRPSVDVITGLIKANMPSRIAFAVTSGVDSRTILDMNGAEKLLGKGDMLFFPYGLSKPVRIQGAFVTDDEVNSVVNFLKMHDPAQESTEELEKKIESLANSGSSSGGDNGAAQGKESDSGVEDLFVDAGFFIIEKNNASIGLLQRRFRIGFNKAARIMDQLCDAGVVSESESTKSRKILMTKAEFQDYVDNYL